MSYIDCKCGLFNRFIFTFLFILSYHFVDHNGKKKVKVDELKPINNKNVRMEHFCHCGSTVFLLENES